MTLLDPQGKPIPARFQGLRLTIAQTGEVLSVPPPEIKPETKSEQLTDFVSLMSYIFYAQNANPGPGFEDLAVLAVRKYLEKWHPMPFKNMSRSLPIPPQ